MSSYLAGQTIDAVDYNTFANSVNHIYGIPTGTWYPPASPTVEFGYNQTPLPNVSVGQSIMASQWAALHSAISRMAAHQGTTVILPPIGRFAPGLPVIAENPPNLFANAIAAISAYPTRFNANGVGATQLQASSSVTRTHPWNNQLYHDVIYRFTSANHMRGYFNSGGQFRFDASLVGGSGSHTASWALMLQYAGTVIYDYQKFYNTGSVYYQFYIIYGSGGYGYGYGYNFNVNSYSIRAKIENGGTDLHFYILFDDPYSHLPDSINGNITSSISMRKASTLYLNDPGITYPSLFAHSSNFVV